MECTYIHSICKTLEEEPLHLYLFIHHRIQKWPGFLKNSIISPAQDLGKGQAHIRKAVPNSPMRLGMTYGERD